MPTLVSSDHEQAQQNRILRVLLGAVFAGSAFAGAVNLVNGWRPEAFTLLTLALVCPVGLGLLRAGRFYAASMTLSVALLFAIDAAMFLGGGLYDEGVIAYPLFMLCVTFLFPAGRAVLLATTAAVASIVAMYLLEVAGAVDTPVPSTALRVVILSVIVTLSGLVLRAIRHAWEATCSMCRRPTSTRWRDGPGRSNTGTASRPATRGEWPSSACSWRPGWGSARARSSRFAAAPGFTTSVRWRSRTRSS
jgi:hypothetical protein